MISHKPIMIVLFLLGSAGMSYAATAAYMGPGEYQIADMRDVVYDDGGGTIVRSSDGECVRTRWMNNMDECSSQIAAPVEKKTALNLSREERTVYFGFNQASLSPEMRQKLDSLAGILTSSGNVKGARIVGYADRIGNPNYNEKLSKKRAENVKHYLIAHGLINTQVADTRWLGSADPVTSCPDNLKRPELLACLQPDRRVEVEIDYASNVQAAR
jgi:OOP family OmpA-OmpF porin